MLADHTHVLPIDSHEAVEPRPLEAEPERRPPVAALASVALPVQRVKREAPRAPASPRG